MKMLSAVYCALFFVSVLVCSQQASTVPAAAQPGNPPAGSASTHTSDVNTFGESKDTAADAAQARAQSWGGSGQDSSKQANAPDPANPPPPRQ